MKAGFANRGLSLILCLFDDFNDSTVDSLCQEFTKSNRLPSNCCRHLLGLLIF